jgi:hypothetical protein
MAWYTPWAAAAKCSRKQCWSKRKLRGQLNGWRNLPLIEKEAETKTLTQRSEKETIKWGM